MIRGLVNARSNWHFCHGSSFVLIAADKDKLLYIEYFDSFENNNKNANEG